MTQIGTVETRLDSFDPRERKAALRELVKGLPNALPGSNVNMHFHSFFSCNALGYSPTRIAWEARKAGLYAAGLCDFDVLDALEEFLAAGLMLGLRSTVNLETRAYMKEYAAVDLNSPGEPGITYVMGAGFARQPEGGSAAHRTLAGFRDKARQRNVALVDRINARLPEIAVSYEKDVLSLTPAQTATERHIVRAYVNRAGSHFQAGQLVSFWARVLAKPESDAAKLVANLTALEEAARNRLVKQGGLAYEPPSVETFPPIEDFFQWVLSCRAIPMMTWLDGMSAGESRSEELLLKCREKGAAAINIIPDRNWNIRDAAAKAAKTAKLREVVETAVKLHMPINIGTEMNKAGLPFADDLAGEALRPYREAFLAGARIFVGHTWLLRYADFPFVGAGAAAEFGGNGGGRNRFFESVGKLPPLTAPLASRLEEIGGEKALAFIRDSARAGEWKK